MLKDQIIENLQWTEVAKRPSFLKKYKWCPKYLFREEEQNKYIAVEVIYNEKYSNKIFEKEVARAKQKESELEVCLFTSIDESYEKIKELCEKHGFGLKVYGTQFISTLVPLTFEEVETPRKTRKTEEGWFPEILLEEVKKIENLRFKDEVINLANNLKESTSDDERLAVIKDAIDNIFKSFPRLPADSYPFMSLSHFESLLSYSNIQHSDHVFHSVRVFLIGCIIIDRFHNQFLQYYHELLNPSNVNVEYIWMLTSLFHDIGKIHQESYRIYLVDPEGEDNEFQEFLEGQMGKRWEKKVYQNVLCNLIELIEQSKTSVSQREIPFIGDALSQPQDGKLSDIIISNYNKRRHGIVSCFEMAVNLLEKLTAVKSRSKTFPLYHVFPAALAIALHDWRSWQSLMEADVMPIKISNFPLAALLIFIDTWDDYKRRGKDEIKIDSFNFSDNGVTVTITWFDTKRYLEEKTKYESFEENVIFDDLQFKINISNAS